MAHTCSECTYLDLNKEYESNDGRYWCESDLEWHYAHQKECWRFCKAYTRNDYTAEETRKYSEERQNNIYTSPCYLTTITCEILGLPDDNIYLKTLRKFREEKLQKDDLYKEILVEYDIVGPIIAERLKQEEKRDIIAKNLLNLGISKTVFYILNNQDLKAIETYTTMTKLLIQACNINIKPTLQQIKNADISKSGHGIYTKKYS